MDHYYPVQLLYWVEIPVPLAGGEEHHVDPKKQLMESPHDTNCHQKKD